MQRADRVLEGLARDDVRRAQVALDQLDDLAPGGLGQVRAARVDRRDRRAARRRQPSASVTQAIVDAVPIVMQWPLERDIASSISVKSRSLMRPARSSSW